MASPRGRAPKMIVPGRLTEQSRHFSMVLLVEKVERKEFKEKSGSGLIQYCVIVGIGEDGRRQDCVCFGEANENLPDISVGACFGPR